MARSWACCSIGLLVLIISTNLVGCSDQPRTPSEKEVQQYQEQMKSAVQREGQQRPPEGEQ
ncbi:MAG: hypothetical protein NZM42_10690 [Gemmatales bacterium]|nr:hypothetical protein [Gemmatales bacterium]MDW8223265.1 hypothetical protein [Gemmatales bacterium]